MDKRLKRIKSPKVVIVHGETWEDLTPHNQQQLSRDFDEVEIFDVNDMEEYMNYIAYARAKYLSEGMIVFKVVPSPVGYAIVNA